jgi:hypothetical protein
VPAFIVAQLIGALLAWAIARLIFPAPKPVASPAVVAPLNEETVHG